MKSFLYQLKEQKINNTASNAITLRSEKQFLRIGSIILEICNGLMN